MCGCGELPLLSAAAESVGPKPAEASDKPALDNAELTAKIQALETEIAALKSRLDAVEQGEPAPEKWLYDGNGIKRFRVVDHSLFTAWVDIGDGRVIYYNTDTVPGPNTYSDSTESVTHYATADCTGPIYSVGLLRRDQIVIKGNDVYYVAPGATSKFTTYSYWYHALGTCTKVSTPQVMTPLTKEPSLTRSDFELKLPLEVR